MDATTIVAIATPPGFGGVGIVRLSGAKALQIASAVSHIQTFSPRMTNYASFYNEDHTLLDKGLIIYFKAPHSFTGEEVVEFQVHGSPFVLDALLKHCVALGACMARPGEFTERAFLNDKMDLTQAEAVADLIHARSETAAKLAVRSLQGDFSKTITELNQQIIHLRMYVEAAIDFPEEEIDFLNDGYVLLRLKAILKQLLVILASAASGVILQEGLTVVIAGPPNAGKSTLINQLAGREIAIVTHLPGTTRDIMRASILMDDIPIEIIDTAGLRDSEDIIEQEGIRRAYNELKKADCILFLRAIDVSADEVMMQTIASHLLPGTPVVTVINKIDILEKPQERNEHDNAVYISAKSGVGLDVLKASIKAKVGYQAPAEEGLFLARRRHLEALHQAQNYLNQGLEQLQLTRSGELLAEDLRLAHHALGEITGEFSSDDLLGEIFSSFCIGK